MFGHQLRNDEFIKVIIEEKIEIKYIIIKIERKTKNSIFGTNKKEGRSKQVLKGQAASYGS